MFGFCVSISFLYEASKIHKKQNVLLDSGKILLELEQDKNAAKSTERKPLNLNITWGKNVYTDNDGGDARLELTLDVINNETRKILDLEAYFVIVYQLTKQLPDDWSIVNSFRHFRNSRLEWRGGKYNIDLTPGFPETFVKIVGLDLSKSEMTFVHEGNVQKLKEFGQDAMYRIVVEFKGRLDGSEPDYRFFHHETYFVCSPLNSQIGSWIREKNNPNLPNWIRERIDLLLNDKNGSLDDK